MLNLSSCRSDRIYNKVIRKLKYYHGRLTCKHRDPPDFLIIGGQRCGTTSLYSDICQHPCIVSALKKEIHFFDGNFNKGEKWYRAHFATRQFKKKLIKKNQEKILTGESTPYYLLHPDVPERVYSVIPNIKLVVMLRHPVERAYSHYNHAVSRGREWLSFEKAIEREFEAIKKNNQNNFNFYEGDFNYKWHSYISRGLYINQLKSWLNFFPLDKILIIRSENYFKDPSSILESLFNFLELPNYQTDRYCKLNMGKYKKIDTGLESMLADFYEPYNRELYRFLNDDYGW